MGLTPLFRRGDSVYLASSAAVGQLEGYKVTTAAQRGAGSWVYTIQFLSRPPEQGTIGDRYDLRTPPYSIYYSEEELLTFCDAMVMVIQNLERRLNNINKLKSGCPQPVSPVAEEEPKFKIDEPVWFIASAKIGFLESSKILGVTAVPAGTASRKTRFVYQVAKKPNLVFGEDELVRYCDAVNLVIASLDGQLTAMRQKLTQCKK